MDLVSNKQTLKAIDEVIAKLRATDSPSLKAELKEELDGLFKFLGEIAYMELNRLKKG